MLGSTSCTLILPLLLPGWKAFLIVWRGFVTACLTPLYLDAKSLRVVKCFLASPSPKPCKVASVLSVSGYLLLNHVSLSSFGVAAEKDLPNKLEDT